MHQDQALSLTAEERGNNFLLDAALTSSGAAGAIRHLQYFVNLLVSFHAWPESEQNSILFLFFFLRCNVDRVKIQMCSFMSECMQVCGLF